MSETDTRRIPAPGEAPLSTSERAGPPPVAPGGPGPRTATAPAGAPYDPYPGSGGPRDPGKKRIPWLWIVVGVGMLGAVGYAVWPKPAAQRPGQFGPGPGGPGGPGGPPGAGGGRFGGGATSVNIAKVQSADVPIYLNALGAVTPTATVIVRSQVSGQLTQVGFTEGQLVRKGEFLAQIDPRPFQQVLNQAEAALARDQATVANARVVLQRYQTLLTQDSIARQQVDDQQAVVRSLEATLKSDQATVGAARLNLTYARVVSPVSGRVGLRKVDVGNYVSTGDTNGIVVVTEIAPIDVLFTAPEDQLRQLNQGQARGAAMPADAFDRSQSTKLATGKFLTLDNQVDTATGTVKAKARFDNADGSLFPNQFVNIRLLTDTVRGAMTVPSSAVLRGAQGMFVYVVQPDRTVTVRNVVPGVVSGAQTVIASGLKLGETVVIDGADRLREGARVLLPGDCPPAQGAFGPGGQRRQGAGGQGAQGQGAQGQGAPKGGQGQGRRAGGVGAAAGCTPTPAAAQGGSGFGSATSGAVGGPASPIGGAAPGGAPGGAGMLAQLNLDATQMPKAQAALSAARARAAESPGDPDARRQAMRQAFSEIEPILRPDQKAKLKELQADGGGFRGAGGPGAGGPGGAPQGGAN